jgi:predicted dinucleotide-binding enzyme
MNIGIIGAGQIGSVLARKLSEVGHTVALANSRGPDTLAGLAAQVGASAVSVEDATRDVDVVIVTIPEKNIPLLPKDLFDQVSKDVVVIDTGNYYPGLRDDPIAAVDAGMPESGWVARQLGRPVVKVFNNIMAHSLAHEGRPAGDAGRIALPVSGDDARAKAIVIGLVDAIGFDGVDAGDLEASWRQQPGTPVYCTDYDIEGVRRALAKADKASAPALRDRTLEMRTQLPKGATPKDMVNLLRSLG